MDLYQAALLRCAGEYGGIAADTLYFGGGTPSLMGGARLASMITTLRKQFDIGEGAEVSAEINPEACDDIFVLPAAAGLNRVSIGMQSAHENELRAVGRQHGMEDTARIVSAARAAGIDNISLDIILGLPEQTEGSLIQSIERAAVLGAAHISCYMLSVEPGTPLYSRMKNQAEACMPDGDMLAELYLAAVERLKVLGYAQYEISNFAWPGKACRHNLKYWRSEPYLGLGPAAHSFLNGRRFYYPSDAAEFMDGRPPIADDDADTAAPTDSWQERLLLQTRLNEGFDLRAAEKMSGFNRAALLRKAKPMLDRGLTRLEGDRLCLSPEGMLLQNDIAARLI